MKLLTSALILILSTTTAFAQDNFRAFERAKKSFVQGTFTGKTSYDGNKCTATIMLKKVNGADVLTGQIDYLDRRGNFHSQIVEINSVSDKADFNLEDSRDYKEVSMVKSKSIPDPTDEEMEIDLIESIAEIFEGGKLVEVELGWFAINEHSDPAEDKLICKF